MIEKQFEALLERLFAVEQEKKMVLGQFRLHPEYMKKIPDYIWDLSLSIGVLEEKVRILEELVGWKPSLKVED